MYVERENGKIKGVFRWPNERATEKVRDDDPDLVAYRNRGRPASKFEKLLNALIAKGLITEQDIT
jgi:hypothetical protein